jgi:hypothetical protein
MSNHADGVASGVSAQNDAIIGLLENPAKKAILSFTFGRAWVWIKNHPSWTPGVSTGTGLLTGVVYLVIAAIAAVALCGGVCLGVVSSFIPTNQTARNLKEYSIKWIAACENFLSTGLRLSVRGFASSCPGLGNVIIFIADRYNNKNQDEEHLWCLLEERDSPQPQVV